MSTTKHPKAREGRTPFRDDLERNPGIGQSPGSFATGEPPQSIEGDNTVEGDIGNDATALGVVPDYRGRTNK